MLEEGHWTLVQHHVVLRRILRCFSIIWSRSIPRCANLLSRWLLSAIHWCLTAIHGCFTTIHWCCTRVQCPSSSIQYPSVFFGDTPQADHGVGSVNLGTNSYSDGTFGAHKDAHPEHHHDKEYHHDGDHHEHHHHDHHDKDHHARISTITSTATKNITQAIRHESSLPAVQEPSQYPSHHEDAARGTLHHEQQSVSSSTCPVCGHSAACVTCAGYIKLDLAISALQAHVITIKNESLEFARKWGSR